MMFNKTFLRFMLLATVFLALAMLHVSQVTVQAKSPLHLTSQVPQCPIHTNTHGRLFLEPWEALNGEENSHKWGAYLAQVSSATVNSAQITPWAEAPLTNWSVGSHILNQTNTNTQQLNLLFESAAEVGDGVIETCIRLPQLPPTASVFPHGVAFRIQHDPQDQTVSGFAVGFVNDNTLALGQVLNNEATRLGLAQVSWSATQWTKLKIELSGSTIRVYAALEGTEYPLNPLLTTTSGTATSQGMVGLATYGITGEFSPISVDFTCSGVLLDPVEQAMLNRFANTYTIDQTRHKTPSPYFCGNEVGHLIEMKIGSTGTDKPSMVYDQFATLIEQAKYEINFTSLWWHDVFLKEPYTADGLALTHTLMGQTDIDKCEATVLDECKGLAYLYHYAKTHPEEYPHGLKIRLLVGQDSEPDLFVETVGGGINMRRNILNKLKEYGIPIYDTLDVNADTKWEINVVYYPNFARHSHVKLLLIDSEIALVGGYNVSYHEDDLGMIVSGPIVFESLMAFDSLWAQASAHQANTNVPAGLCLPGTDNILTIPISNCSYYFIEPIDRYAPPLYAVKKQTANDTVFPILRSPEDLTGDLIFGDGIRAAETHINIMQDRFALSSPLWTGNPTIDPLEFMDALEEAVFNNQADPNFKVRLIVDGNGGDVSHSKPAIEYFVEQLGNDWLDYFDFRLVKNIHMKTAQIDDVLVLGSQNWDFSSWHEHDSLDTSSFPINLAEYSYATSSPTIVNEYETYFNERWAVSSCAIWTDSNWSGDLGCLHRWFRSQLYTMSNPVQIQQSMQVRGNKGLTIIQKATPTTQAGPGLPVFHVLTNDVTIADLIIRNSDGYAIEIGDGVTPLKNIVISGVVFENNALGAIKLNGPVEVTIENNTFINGDTGIAINHSGVTTGTTIIRNNIFYGQAAHTIRVDSADDGRVLYRHNLFNQCVRAVAGVCPTSWLTGNLHPESEMANNLVNVNPLFVDFANHNYNLLTTSPAIDAGAAETRHHLDLDGDGDGVPLPDMGALGYVPAEEFEFTLVLQTPLPNALLATPEVAFTWAWVSETVPTPAVYHLQIARDGQFTDLVVDNPAVTTTELAQSWAGLENGTYYWRVGHGSAPETWSQIRAFDYQNNPAYLPVLLR